MCMQIGPPLSKKKNSSITGKLCMKIIMKMVYTHMFSWSRINISPKMSLCEYMCVRPGAMHTITSLLGCIWTLMKGSSLDILVGAAFGGMNGIITGVPWVRAMRAFRIVLATLLQNFLRTGGKTFE